MRLFIACLRVLLPTPRPLFIACLRVLLPTPRPLFIACLRVLLPTPRPLAPYPLGICFLLLASLTSGAWGQSLVQVGNESYGMTVERVEATERGIRVKVLVENLTAGREIFLHHEANQLNAQDFFFLPQARRNKRAKHTFILPIAPQGTLSAEVYFPFEENEHPGLLVMGSNRPPFEQVAVSVGPLLKARPNEIEIAEAQMPLVTPVPAPMPRPAPPRATPAPATPPPPRPTPAPIAARPSPTPKPIPVAPTPPPTPEPIQIVEDPGIEIVDTPPTPAPTEPPGIEIIEEPTPEPEYQPTPMPRPRPQPTRKPQAAVPLQSRIPTPEPPGPPRITVAPARPPQPATQSRGRMVHPGEPRSRVVFLPSIPGDRILQAYSPPHPALGTQLILRAGKKGKAGYGWNRIAEDHPDVAMGSLGQAASYPHQIWTDGRTYLYLRWQEDQQGAMVLQVAGDTIVSAQWATYDELLFWLGPTRIYPRLVYQGAR